MKDRELGATQKNYPACLSFSLASSGRTWLRS